MKSIDMVRNHTNENLKIAGIKEDQAEKLAMCLGQRMMNRQKAQKEKDSFER